MALWECRDCTTRYAVGLFRCPHCRAVSQKYTEDNVPKITVHGGPTNGIPEGGEDLSPGISSSTSTPRESRSTTTTSPGPRKRARTTGNRSVTGRRQTPGPESNSTALSTGGLTPATGSDLSTSDPGGM